jgi:acetyl-CoA carboxylase biotin carboxyl carrier protein
MPGKNSARRVPERARVLNLADIQELLDLLAAKEITEFELEQQGVKIRVRRGGAPALSAGNSNGYLMVPGSAATVTAAIATPVSPVPASAPKPSAPPETPESAGDSTEGLFIMKSPIVGTFYSSPSPNAPPFVKVGDAVQVGQVICIIEAMKLMNELEAEVAGQVMRIYVESGQPVEYGQSLFAIEPVRKK